MFPNLLFFFWAPAPHFGKIFSRFPFVFVFCAYRVCQLCAYATKEATACCRQHGERASEGSRVVRLSVPTFCCSTSTRSALRTSYRHVTPRLAAGNVAHGVASCSSVCRNRNNRLLPAVRVPSWTACALGVPHKLHAERFVCVSRRLAVVRRVANPTVERSARSRAAGARPVPHDGVRAEKNSKAVPISFPNIPPFRLGFYVIIWPKIEKGLPAWAHARVHASHATPVALAAVHLAGVPLPPGTPGPSLAPLAASALAVAGAYCVALHADAARSKRGFVCVPFSIDSTRTLSDTCTDRVSLQVWVLGPHV